MRNEILCVFSDSIFFSQKKYIKKDLKLNNNKNAKCIFVVFSFWLSLLLHCMSNELYMISRICMASNFILARYSSTVSLYTHTLTSIGKSCSKKGEELFFSLSLCTFKAEEIKLTTMFHAFRVFFFPLPGLNVWDQYSNKSSLSNCCTKIYLPWLVLPTN